MNQQDHESIGKSTGCLVERIFVGRRPTLLGRCCHQAECRGPSHLLGSEDAAVKRAEANSPALEDEARPQSFQRDEVVITSLQLADMLER